MHALLRVRERVRRAQCSCFGQGTEDTANVKSPTMIMLVATRVGSECEQKLLLPLQEIQADVAQGGRGDDDDGQLGCIYACATTHRQH